MKLEKLREKKEKLSSDKSDYCQEGKAKINAGEAIFGEEMFLNEQNASFRAENLKFWKIQEILKIEARLILFAFQTFLNS